MSENILNLDNIHEVSRKFVYNGKTHTVRQMTVQDFIRATRRAKELAAADAGVAPDFDVQLERMVDSISEFVSDITKEELMAMPADKLGLLMKFIRGDNSDAETTTDTQS